VARRRGVAVAIDRSPRRPSSRRGTRSTSAWPQADPRFSCSAARRLERFRALSRRRHRAIGVIGVAGDDEQLLADADLVKTTVDDVDVDALRSGKIRGR
jgi:hypothetical protein